MGTVNGNPLSRPLLAGENLKGRTHAYRGIELFGEIRVPKRAVRSLCGTPIKATSLPFVVTDDPLICQACCGKIRQGEE